MRLYETGRINQTNEVRLQALGSQVEELERLREAVNFYQRALVRQQGAMKYAKKQHALIIQSLTHEFQCHQVTTQSLKHERTQVRDFIGFLDTLHLPRTTSLTEKSLDALWLERNDLQTQLEHQTTRSQCVKKELKNVQEELQNQTTKTKYLKQELEHVQKELDYEKFLVKRFSEHSGPENVSAKEEHMVLGSNSDEKADTPSEESSDENKGDVMIVEGSGDVKSSMLKSIEQRQQRKRRHS